MKSIDAKISLAGMASLLLIAASLLGFSFVMSTAATSSSIDEEAINAAEDNGSTTTATTLADNTSLNATATSTATASTVELTEEPFAVGYYRTESEDITAETQTQFSFKGNTIITLPNATQTITTMDTGEATFSFLPGGGGSSSGQIQMTTEDGSENATADFAELIKFDSSTGIGISYFSTNSTGTLAPLNNMIAVFLDEIQPNEDSIIRFFEWKSGGAPTRISDNSTTTTNDSGNEPAPATNQSTSESNVEDLSNTTEEEQTSELRCINPGDWPCCIEPLTEPPDPRCLEKSRG
jgi:hypothetical protein